MTHQEAAAKAQELKGTYKGLSPYHTDKKKYLPFVVTGQRTYNENYPIECIVVEYKGWKRSEITTGYKYESVKEMIESGRLIKV